VERLRSVIQGKGANSCGICNIPATEYECCAVPCTQQWGTPSQCLNDKITVTMVVTAVGSCSAADKTVTGITAGRQTFSDGSFRHRRHGHSTLSLAVITCQCCHFLSK
jgi:hypothetical protein